MSGFRRDVNEINVVITYHLYGITTWRCVKSQNNETGNRSRYNRTTKKKKKERDSEGKFNILWRDSIDYCEGKFIKTCV